MKKTITKPDGTKEILEGTPEEIAELERQIKKEKVNENQGDNRRILNEEEIRKMINDEVAKIPWFKVIEVPVPQTFPVQPWRPYFEPYSWNSSDSIFLDDGYTNKSFSWGDV
ncbi:MAG: hypothetical protein WC895_05170 [Candidatus Shapirobacteria bacterium]|jgi:hypothetical protein